MQKALESRGSTGRKENGGKKQGLQKNLPLPAPLRTVGPLEVPDPGAAAGERFISKFGHGPTTHQGHLASKWQTGEIQ